jgi:predicted nuclease of predicted toxin-antitoxin system
MRILLDENIPAKVNYDFGKGQEVRSIKEMQWLGKKNGELLGLAAFNGFDVVITLDKNLKNQQNLGKVSLKFIVLLAKNNKPETIQPFVEKIKALLLKGSDLPKLTELTLD